MDLNYAKWDKVVEEDSTEDSSGEGKRPSDTRNDKGEDGTGCGDPSCSTCGPSTIDFFNNMPDHFTRFPLFSSFTSSAANHPSGLERSVMEAMAAKCDPGAESARASVAAAAAASRGGGSEGRPSPTEEEKACEDPDVPALESATSSSEGEGEDDGGGGAGAAGAGAPGDGDSEGSSSSEEESNSENESEVSSIEGPPALNSSSDSGSATTEDAGLTLYTMFAEARESQPASSMSMDFWAFLRELTPPMFTEFYEDKVLNGRPVPFMGTTLFIPRLIRGYPEFVCFMGQMKEDKAIKSIGGDHYPRGFLKYARENASDNAKMVQKELNATPPGTRIVKAPSMYDKLAGAKDATRQTAREKSRRASEQAAKLSGRAKDAGDSSRGKGRNVKDKSKGATQDIKTVSRKGSGGGSSGDGGRFGDGIDSVALNCIRRKFESVSCQRREANDTAATLEREVRVALKTLDQTLERQRARHDQALAKERAALAAAEVATAAATAAAASAEAGLRVSGSGGTLPVKEALEQAEALKKRANMILADTRYPEAVEQYTLGIKVLDIHVPPADGEANNDETKGGDSDEDAEGNEKGVDNGTKNDEEEDKDTTAARELLLILLCNRSLAHLKWGNLGSAKQDAQQAMDIDPHHIKAYFRRAAAHKQAERYREALSDLRYMLRLEPPPVKGVPVSDDILAVQKMARECEQKVRAKGFKKALEETNTAKAALSAPTQKEARKKWDATRAIGKKKGKVSTAMSHAPATGKTAAAWDVGESFLPPRAELPTLKHRAAVVAAECIDRAPEAYVHWCEGLLSEYLVCVFERLSWVSLQTMMASGLYNEICTISSNAQTDFWQAQDKEYRRLYAATTHEDFLKASEAVTGGGAGTTKTPGGASPLLLSSRVLNPHLGLVDVLESNAVLTYQAWDAEEEATPKLFNFMANRLGGRAVVNREEFFQQFNVFSEGQLMHLDWNNVVAAGGSVLATIHPPPPGPLRDFYHTLAYRASDVDLFLYGLDEKQATEKVRQIFAAVKQANPKIFAVRGLRAITFVSEFPYRKVQIVLRLYKTLAEVLHGFDVDACSVGFDGHTVWATNRAARAICKRYNVVDLSRRSPSYESRLFKYGKRGHAVFVRGLKVDKVKPSLDKTRITSYAVDRESGLAKLIAMDACYRRFHLAKWTEFYARWNEGLLPSVDGQLQESRRIHRQENARESDYTSFFIPYGPKWGRTRTLRHIDEYISSANSWYYRLSVCDPAQAPIQPVVCGTIDNVLATGVNTGEGEGLAYSHDEETSLMRMKHVTGDEMWLKVNPGLQGSLLTGSFQPMTSSKDEWERGAYKTRR